MLSFHMLTFRWLDFNTFYLWDTDDCSEWLFVMQSGFLQWASTNVRPCFFYCLRV